MMQLKIMKSQYRSTSDIEGQPIGTNYTTNRPMIGQIFFKKMLSISALLISPSLAIAEYHLIFKNQTKEFTPYAQIEKIKGGLWSSLNSVEESRNFSTVFSFQEMHCSSEDKAKEIKSPGSYFFMPSISITHNQPIAMPVVDYMGEWNLLQLDEKVSKIQRTQPMKDVSIIRAGATSPKGYFFGGFNTKKQPLLIFYSKNLKRQKILSEKDVTEGEVSSVFNRGKEIAAIYNQRNDENSSLKFSSELRIYSAAGSPVAKVRLDGLDGSGLSLKDGSIVVSYWKNGTIYMEKFNPYLSHQWKIPLHQLDGISSSRGIMLQVENDLAWVGGNNDNLVIHRVKHDGSALSTRIESTHGLSAPQPLIYAASAYGKEIHVRGRTNRGKSQTIGSATEFCLVETP